MPFIIPILKPIYTARKKAPEGASQLQSISPYFAETLGLQEKVQARPKFQSPIPLGIRFYREMFSTGKATLTLALYSTIWPLSTLAVKL